MKIAIVGTGNIGGTLGGKWAAAGHEVVFGTRQAGAEKVQGVLAQVGHGVTAVSPHPTSLPNPAAHPNIVKKQH